MHDYIENLREVYNVTEDLKRSTRETSYYIDRLEYFQKELFKYSKFNNGDIVYISKDLEINKDSGWYSYKESLKVDCKGTIVEIDHYAGNFRYSVEMVEVNNGIFTLNEEYLKKETGYDD